MVKYALLLLLVSITAQAQHLVLSGIDQKEDITILKSNLEKYHPGLSRYTTRDSIEYAFDLVNARITDQPIDCFYAEVTWLLSKVRCGHTRSAPPSSMHKKFIEREVFLPIDVKYLNHQLYIKNKLAHTPALNIGDEIVAINNQPISDITSTIFSHIPADGLIETSKYQQVGTNFSFYYQLYVGTGSNEYQLQLRDTNDVLRCVTIAGIPWEQLEYDEEERLPLSLSFNTNYALLDIRTFGSRTISQSGQDYYDFLESSFREIKQKNVKNLIMDLRGNGGGDDNYGATLVSYFARESFGYFDRIEVTDNYDGYGKVTLKNGKHLMTSHRGLDKWEPQPNRFDGNVYVLIDGFSFSTCADVATVLHHHQLATFIGEETGGGYDGNTSGNSKSLVLPNSGIRINLPMWKYTTANIGHPYYGRGVIPDFPIEQTRQELIENKDPEMKKALRLLQHP
ncbi:MAG: S41 family peptidase [Cyclobacteriaceae bacterium]